MSSISVLISENDIKCKVNDLGKKISEYYEGRKLLVVSVLKGAFVFTADLVRCIDADVQIAFIRAKSYEGTCSTGNVQISGDSDFTRMDLKEYDILLVEDILDTGKTLCSLKEYFIKLGAKSVKIAVFLDKPSRRIADIRADYMCFEIEDKFVVGYGLDFDEKYRNLPYVGVLEQRNIRTKGCD